MKRHFKIAVCFLVFVASLLALLSALFLPTFTPRKSSRRGACISNMSQVAMALLNYESAHGHFPPPYTVDAEGNPLHSWRTLLLPYMEQNILYEKIRLDEPWDSPYNSQFHSFPQAFFRCRNDNHAPAESFTSYDVVVGENTVFPPFDGEKQPRVTVDDIGVTSGTPMTILLVERKTPIHWMDPTPLKIEDIPDEIAMRHGPNTVLAFADRSVYTVSPLNISPELFRKFCEWKNRTPDSLTPLELLPESEAFRQWTQEWERRQRHEAAGHVSLVVFFFLATLLSGFLLRKALKPSPDM